MTRPDDRYLASEQRVRLRGLLRDEEPAVDGTVTCTKCLGSGKHPSGYGHPCPRCGATGRLRAPEPPTPSPSMPVVIDRGRMRRRAIWRALKFGALPSWTYEDDPHYDCGYWRHLGMNLAYAWRWLTRREDDEDRKFERETNWCPVERGRAQ